MQRIKTYIENCKNMNKANFIPQEPPKHSSKKRGKGSKRKRDDDASDAPDNKKTKLIPCNCDENKNWIKSSKDWKQLIKQKTKKQILTQLSDHRVSTTGIKRATKGVLQQKLKEHYSEQHAQQWKACTNVT